MEKRFEFVERDGFMEGTRIIVDKETGVQYLLAHWTNVGGLTVLLDRDGKPLLAPGYEKKTIRTPKSLPRRRLFSYSGKAALIITNQKNLSELPECSCKFLIFVL